MGLTITLESLSVEAPEQRATQTAKRGPLVIVNFEPMRDVDAKPTSSCILLRLLIMTEAREGRGETRQDYQPVY